MRELHLIVPGLASWRASPHGERVSLPGLERLLARGVEAGGETNLADALCSAFGFHPRGPIAFATAGYDGLNADSGYWLRADPVHLQVGMRGLTLLDAERVGLVQSESASLAASLRPLFEEAGWQLFAPVPSRWYGHPAQTLEMRTTPLDQVTTRHVHSAMPAGPDAARAMRLVNDAQILLHDHPVNQAREHQGLAAINSLWLWGGGEKAKARRRFDLVLAGQVEALALARVSGSPHISCPAGLHDLPHAASVLLLLPEFPPHATAAEASRLDAAWFTPLLQHLRRGHIRRVVLTLCEPEGGSVQLGMGDAWKLWVGG